MPLITIRLTAGRSDADLAELVRRRLLRRRPGARIARGGRLLLDLAVS